METSVKFSILVPVYKAEAFIHECVDSVLNQSYSNFELVLVDDGSPDKSGAICDEYAAKDSRVKVFHKPNGGSLQTRCHALENATGDYCIFLDSDDYLASDCLELLEKNIRETGAHCIIYGIEWLKPGGTVHVCCHEAYCGRLITDKSEVLNIVMNDASFNSLCRKCVKASCFEGRDFSPYYHIAHGEDRLQSLEILENAESFLFIPEALYFYRVNDGSVTHTKSYDGYKADFTVEESSLALIKKLDVFSESDYDRHRNFILDAFVVELKLLSRFCSDRENTLSGFESIQNSRFYKDFLSLGYRNAPALPGINERLGLRRVLNKLVCTLFKARLYDAVIFINRHIYR